MLDEGPYGLANGALTDGIDTEGAASTVAVARDVPGRAPDWVERIAEIH